MASNLVQLSFKAGIQRDGTSFQGDYCIDGQWVRFQRGKPKKMKGMKGSSAANMINLNISDFSFLPNNNQIFYYMAGNLGVYSGSLDKDTFNSLAAPVNLFNAYGNNPLVKWSSTTIIRNNIKYAVFLSADNANDISQNTASRLFYGPVFGAGQLTEVNIGAHPLVNGGLCYAHPFLFLYGSNGLVLYSSLSAANVPISFPPAAAAGTNGSINITSDKVIYGAPIRGGANSPSLLFWTLSAVVRWTNIGDDVVKFKSEVISSSSSILSSKSVVEYDGLFFWVGTERFFVYNGVVQEMANPANLNYFFDNIDMNFRQNVFGVKNLKYGEIWWFYPEKIGTPGRDPGFPAGVNTRAIIYNKRENSWYDTAISRDSGFYSEDFGFLATYGRSLTDPVNPPVTKYLWRHEFNNNEVIEGVGAFDRPITSSITTPIFGWSCFNPATAANNTKSAPVDRWTELRRIEPDFILDAAADMSVVVKTQDYAQSPVVSSAAFTFNGRGGANLVEKIDLRIQGRQMFLTFESSSNFEMGNIMLLLGIGDGQ